MFHVELNVGFGGNAVVGLHGELDVAGVPALASQLIAAAAARGPSVIMDLAGLDFIDCFGMGVLVRARKWARKSGGDVLLAAPQQHVRRLLRLMGLDGDFPVYSSVEQAASGAKLAHPVPAGAPSRTIPSRRPGVAGAPSWYAARARSKAALGAYWLN